MAETTAKPQTATTQATAADPAAAQQANAEQEREHAATAVVEVTLQRAVDAGADHNRTATTYESELQQATGDQWEEVGRRVKSVRVRPV